MNKFLSCSVNFEGNNLDNSASAATTHDGTIINGGSATYSSDTPGIAGGSTSLNLTGGSILRVNNSASGDAGYVDTFDNYSALTLAFYFKTNAATSSAWDSFVNKGGDTGYHIRRFSTLDQTRGSSNGGSNDITGSSSYTDGLWHHYALTWDGSTQSYYVDGALINTRSVLSAPNVASVALLVGAENETGFRAASGYYDEIRFYNSALDASQVFALTTVPEPGHYAVLMECALAVGLVIKHRRKD